MVFDAGGAGWLDNDCQSCTRIWTSGERPIFMRHFAELLLNGRSQSFMSKLKV